MLLRTCTLALAALAAATLALEASGSELIDRNTRSASLKVNAAGKALVSYRANGRTRRVVAWGAINARPPSRGVPQTAFRLDYSGRGFSGGSCGAYDGPALPWLVGACKAPDGSYWALQAWQRLKPNYGGSGGAWELRLSHWTGPIPVLQVKTDWAYRRFDHLYGWYTYAGSGVYGFRTASSGSPLDAYGRNLYVDTFDSRYGSGWRRENSFVTHRPNGSFCYGFYPHGSRPTGKGTRYRATIVGPGVTPDVLWEGRAPGPFDRPRELAANQEQKALFAGGAACRPR